MGARVAHRTAVNRCQESRQDRLFQVLEALDAGDEDRFVFRLHQTVPKGSRGVPEVPAEGYMRIEDPDNCLLTRTGATCSVRRAHHYGRSALVQPSGPAHNDPMGSASETMSVQAGSSGARQRTDRAGDAERERGLRMRDADAILWALDQEPILRSTIVAVALLDREPPFERVVEKVEALCRQRHHFRSVVVPSNLPWGRPRWQEVPEFEVASHLAHVRAPLPGDLRGVLDLAQSMAGRPFDPARPLWEAVLVDGMADGAAALIIKVHHSVIDGVGGLKVVARHPRPRQGGCEDSEHRRRPGSSQGRTGRVRARIGLPFAAVPSSARGTPSPTSSMVPRRFPASSSRSARQAVNDPPASIGRWFDAVVDSAALVAPSPTPLSPLMQGRSLDRHFETVDLQGVDLHHAARRAGLTLNDLYVAGLLRGLSRYHDLHGRPATLLRALMPVSTPPPGRSTRDQPVRARTRDAPRRSRHRRRLPGPGARAPRQVEAQRGPAGERPAHRGTRPAPTAGGRPSVRVDVDGGRLHGDRCARASGRRLPRRGEGRVTPRLPPDGRGGVERRPGDDGRPA